MLKRYTCHPFQIPFNTLLGEVFVGKRTPFYDEHLKAGAKIVDFAGWEMPLHYGSQIKEHLDVRQHAGMFDVSHMGIVDLHGAHAQQYLRTLIANNIDKLVPGKALYTCMLNDKGGVIDDLIIYKVADDFFRVVINAGTREKDIAWMQQKAAPYHVEMMERSDLVMLAIQGPEAKDKIASILPQEQTENVQNLKPFTFMQINHNGLFIARTGYTGEDGFELIFPANKATQIWQTLLNAGVVPCGLGARDTLRLEAGLNLYGNDMDEAVTPLESNLAWTVVMEPKDRTFVGRGALEKQIEEGIKHCLVGLVLEGPGIMRQHQKITMVGNGEALSGEGEVTSGGYSPTLEKSIALARVPAGVHDTSECFVEIRNKRVKARVIKPPFVRRGKAMF